MRFNSVRTGNYAQSAQAVTRASDQIYDAAMSGKPDFTKISKAAIQGRSLERRAVTKAEGTVAKAGIVATGRTKLAQEDAKLTREIGERKGKQARMAGVLGGLGALAGGYFLGENRKDDKKAADERDAKFESLIDKTRATYEAALTNNQPGERPKPPQYVKPELLEYPSNLSGSDSSSTSKSSGQSQTPEITDLSSQPVSGSYDLSSLTPQNWQTLSRAVSGEAGPGDDRYGVVASVLNRVSSDKFPGTIRDVVYQNDGKGTYQYEAFTKGTDFNDPKLTADLSSKAGQEKILKALSVLDGRTDFKGRTMLKYRSGEGNKNGMLDPMFHPKGNFYHYSHQT